MTGEADVFLEIDVNIFDGFHIVSSFAGRPFFFAAPKGERSIIDELDATIDRINQSNPQLQETLYKKHFLPSEDNYDLTSAQLQNAARRRPHRQAAAAVVRPGNRRV